MSNNDGVLSVYILSCLHYISAMIQVYMHIHSCIPVDCCDAYWQKEMPLKTNMLQHTAGTTVRVATFNWEKKKEKKRGAFSARGTCFTGG